MENFAPSLLKFELVTIETFFNFKIEFLLLNVFSDTRRDILKFITIDVISCKKQTVV